MIIATLEKVYFGKCSLPLYSSIYID